MIPFGDHAGDEGTGAGPDVDVEVVDGAIHSQQIERAQRAHLVDAAGEPRRRPGRGLSCHPVRAFASPATARCGAGAVELDELPIGKGIMAVGTVWSANRL